MDWGLVGGGLVVLFVLWMWWDFLKFLFRLVSRFASAITNRFRQKLIKPGLSPQASKALGCLAQSKKREPFYSLLDAGGENLYNELSSQEIPLEKLRLAHNNRPAHGWTTVLLAERLIDVGWSIRTGKVAAEVSTEQWEGFFSHLNEAETLLDALLLTHADCYPVYENLLTICQGMSKRDKAEEVFQLAERRFPEKLDLKLRYIRSRARRWGGEAMEGVSYARTQAEQWNQPWRYGLIAFAHVERALDEGNSKKYFADQGVQKELASYFELFVSCPESRQPNRFRESKEILNYFAFCFFRGKNKEMLRKAMTLLGGHMSETPWHIVQGTVLETFQNARAMADLQPLLAK